MHLQDPDYRRIGKGGGLIMRNRLRKLRHRSLFEDINNRFGRKPIA